MREYDPCMGCEYYNRPYWSIISPCASCPRIYGTGRFKTTVTTQPDTDTSNYFKGTEHTEDFIKRFWKAVNEEYSYRDMLDFDEIQKIFDKIKESGAGTD